MLLKVLKWFGLTTIKQAELQSRDALERMQVLMEAQGVNESACCQMHATPAQKMTQMIVCPECGSKRCNKAEICRLPCNDPDNLKEESKSAFV